MLNPLKFAIAFLLIGLTWAVASDPLVMYLARHFGTHHLHYFQRINDFIFVLNTSFFLFFLFRRQHRQLQVSKEKYRELFECNPNPLMIYNRDTLRFVAVNQSALKKYGYNKKRFLKISLDTILPVQYSGNPLAQLKPAPGGERYWAGEHVTSSNELFRVSTISYPTMFDGQQCLLMMSTDITETAKKDQKLKSAYRKIKIINDTLLQVAWSNSHKLRKPLCSITGLLDLLEKADSDAERRQIITHLQSCSAEMDRVLIENSAKISQLDHADPAMPGSNPPTQ